MCLVLLEIPLRVYNDFAWLGLKKMISQIPEICRKKTRQNFMITVNIVNKVEPVYQSENFKSCLHFFIFFMILSYFIQLPNRPPTLSKPSEATLEFALGITKKRKVY